MNLHGIIQSSRKTAVDNSPAILTGFGVAGLITTAYLTGRASFRAYEILEHDDAVRKVEDRPLRDKRETAALLWKLYIPAVIAGSFTCGAIVMANRIGTRRTAAMAAGLAITERAYDEYREKVVETIGKNKEEKVRAEVQQDRINAAPASRQTILVANGGDSLCKDAWSGRYFTSDMESIKKAQNDTNHVVLNHQYASLTDFYNRLGLEPTKESDNVGWNSDKLMEVSFTSAISDEDKPVLVMDFAVAPMRNYFRAHPS